MLFLNALAEARRLRCWRGALRLLGAAMLLAPSALASQVFHSPGDDGVPAIGEPIVAEGGVQSVFLYVDGGALASLAGSACNDGAGDEVCGFSVTLTGLGGLTLSAFNADPGADLLVNLGAGSIVINGLDPVSPTPGPKRIGELLVNAAVGGSVELSGGEVVGADLSTETLLVGTLVVVPEPSKLALLASGLLLLRTLAERRQRRC
jgi:hypothetical protein